ncbi:MAG TPA: energy transducer TonB [Candidatus Angelobacter sp.]|nr:energy transducer TonB [Candidatus Angelobacter sp.]
MVRPIAVALLGFLLTSSAFVAGQDKSVSLIELTSRALSLSRLTQAGGTPFHIRAVVSESGNRGSDYAAEIEEDWVAPNKWRRTIKSREFSQIMIVNGDRMSELDTGAYYPFWLRDMVTAIFDVVPEDFTPRDLRVDAASIAEFSSYTMRQNMQLGGGVAGPYSAQSGQCSRWDDKAGAGPTQNSVFSTVCFLDLKQLSAVSTPYYNARFEEYQDFKHKQVARRIRVYLEPGTIIEAKIADLKELHNPDEAMFTAAQPTPERDRVYSIRRSETDARNLLVGSPEIVWAPVRGGKTSGTMSIAVYVDKQGNVRETRPLNSDNPDPQDQARKEIAQWRFRPQQRDGVPVQMETLLTFPFQTRTADRFPLLSNDQARNLATSKPESSFQHTKFAKGTEYAVRITVSERGLVTDVEDINHLDPGLFAAARTALGMWLFRPYMQDGKPQRFSADIVFHVK